MNRRRVLLLAFIGLALFLILYVCAICIYGYHYANDGYEYLKDNFTILPITEEPTIEPTIEPSIEVTETPSITPTPTEVPTATPTLVPTPTTEPTPTAEPEPTWFIVLATSYTDAENTKVGLSPRGCINDIPLQANWSVASFLDEILPYGTIIEIEKMGTHIVCDTCDKDGIIWKQRKYDITSGKFTRAISWIDIYFDNETDADEFGRMLVKIKVLKYGDGKTYISKEEWENERRVYEY